MSDKPGRTLAFEPGDLVRRIEHGPDGKQIDTPIQTVEMASNSAAWITVKGENYTQGDWKFEHAPGTAKALREAESRAATDTIMARVNERIKALDTSTAKAEIAHGKQDLRTAKQEQQGDLLQQTLTMGRQVEAQKAAQQREQQAETKGRRMRV